MKDETFIFVNQIGYHPHDKKIAYVRENAFGNGDESFSVCDSASNKIVFTGKKSSPKEDDVCKEKIAQLDFSALSQNGTYYVCINNIKSFNFEIGEHVYNDLYCSALNYFTLSRCGQNKCHTTAATVYGTQQKKLVLGGWHDAGDYGRYTVAGTKAVMDLLLSLKNFTDAQKFDVLGEVRFELEWLLQMQREDGAVYHKISCYNFCGFIMSEEEKDELVLSPVSTAATADFAGCLCYSAQFFEATDKAFAEKLVSAALKAQDWLDSHEDELFQNPPDITTGSYGDHNVSDERYFALCSLFCATGKIEYLLKAIEIRTIKVAATAETKFPWEKWREDFSWGMVSGYGSEMVLDFFASVAKAGGEAEFVKQPEYVENKSTIERFVSELKAAFTAQAAAALQNTIDSPFGCCTKMFFWGSNGAVCDIAHALMVCYRLTGNDEYKAAAKKQLDYLLGCNPLNYCYVTKNGSKSPVNPHHRPSGASGVLTGGMLVGGPASGLHDECAKKNLQNTPPMKCYIDHVDSYSTNEVAIYWNSAFVYLLSHFMG